MDSLGANNIQLGNDFILNNECMFFCPKIFFSSKWNLEQNLLQIDIKKVYNWPNIWDMFF
jgi:hypothetical protein